jgi:tRNA (mo5U34)-methyltransferase
MENSQQQALIDEITRYYWYHTIDLGNGLITKGIYDHRPLLMHYGIPPDLTGKTVLDIGASQGFFSFEFERRGAKRVVSTELPQWSGHDASPHFKAVLKEQDMDEKMKRHMKDAFHFAKRALNSKVERIEANIYEVSPETVGVFDVVFCGSLLIHLTNPLRAIYKMQSVVRERCIICTSIYPVDSTEPLAYFHGTADGMAFWAPNMTCLEKMCLAAGFVRVERISTFNLTSVDNTYDSLQGVIHAWNI